MPHEPGHNGYIIVDTGKTYTGKVVKIGEHFYTTMGGGLEGTSKKVETSNVQNNNQNENQITTSTANVNIPDDADTDVITKFNVGDGSVLGNRTYFYTNGNIVPNGTSLHNHSVRPVGATSNVMTSHQMNSQTQDVFTERPNPSSRLSSRRTVNRTTTTTSDNIGGATPPPDITPPPSDGGGNMNQGGGGY